MTSKDAAAAGNEMNSSSSRVHDAATALSPTGVDVVSQQRIGQFSEPQVAAVTRQLQHWL
jgi:hypothetical protein